MRWLIWNENDEARKRTKWLEKPINKSVGFDTKENGWIDWGRGWRCSCGAKGERSWRECEDETGRTGRKLRCIKREQWGRDAVIVESGGWRDTRTAEWAAEVYCYPSSFLFLCPSSKRNFSFSQLLFHILCLISSTWWISFFSAGKRLLFSGCLTILEPHEVLRSLNSALLLGELHL